MNSILQLSWPLAINRHLMRQSRHKGKVCVSWNDWMCEEAQPNTAFSKQNTVPPQRPRAHTQNSPQSHGQAVLGRAVLLGSVSQQGGTEGFHSPAAHTPSIHSQAILSLTPCLPHEL